MYDQNLHWRYIVCGSQIVVIGRLVINDMLCVINAIILIDMADTRVDGTLIRQTGVDGC